MVQIELPLPRTQIVQSGPDSFFTGSDFVNPYPPPSSTLFFIKIILFFTLKYKNIFIKYSTNHKIVLI